MQIPLSLMIDMIVFKSLSEKIDEGNNEFHISSLDLDEDDLKIFIFFFRDLGAVVIKTSK